MRLLRSLISLLVVGGLIYVAVAVPLGKKTLWQHLRAIATTPESQELVREVKEKAKGVVSEGGDAGMSGRDEDRLTPEERRLLRKLIRKKLERAVDAAPAATPGQGEGG